MRISPQAGSWRGTITARAGEGGRLTAHICIDVRVTQGGYPGIGRATAGLVRALLSASTPHRFALLYQPGRPLPAELCEAVLPPHHLLPVGTWLRSAGDQLETPLRLHQARIDLFHSTYYAQALYPGRPYIVMVYDLIPERFPHYWPPLQSGLIRRWSRMASRRAEHIVAPSQASADDLTRLYGTHEARITVTPLAVDTTFLRPVSPISQDDAAAPPAGPYLLCVCTNKPHKNLVRLVQAFAQLATERSNIPDLVIAGGWDARYPEAKELATTLLPNPDRSPAIRFMHNPDDVLLRALYVQALAFVFPSEYEGFGLPVLEAMTAGAPVAASNTAAVAEVADDACVSFDPLSVDAIAGAMRTLIDDEALRARLRVAGAKRAGEFTWARTAERTLAAYEAALCG